MAYGDPQNLPLYLLDAAGSPLQYANLAAATGAGWTFTWVDTAGATLGSPPTLTLVPNGATTGRHDLRFTSPSQDAVLKVGLPSGLHYASPADVVYQDTVADADSLLTSLTALLTSSSGALVTGSTVTTYDQTVVDGDALTWTGAVPASVLLPWGYPDLSTSGWTATGAVRAVGDTGTGTPLAQLLAVITNASTRTITYGWGLFPSALALDATGLAAGQTVLRYDVQIIRTDTYSLTAATSGAGGTLTLAGDLRQRFNPGASITVTGGANAGTYTLASVGFSGGNTVLTVTGSVPSTSVAGSTIANRLTLTVFSGSLTVKRQEDRT